MIYSEYYENYKGPILTKAILNDDQDITELIQKFYGDKNDWCGKLWTYQDVFGYNCKGSKFYCEFKILTLIFRRCFYKNPLFISLIFFRMGLKFPIMLSPVDSNG